MRIKSIVVILVLLGLTQTVQATIYVNESGWSSETFNPTSAPLESAIDNAIQGEEIILRDGTYTESVVVDKKLSIMSENGSANCVIDGYSSYDALEVTAEGVTITGLSITGAGSGEAGVRIDHADNCSVTDCTIWDCDLGVYVIGSSSDLAQSSFVGNNSIYGCEVGIKLSGKGVKDGEFVSNTIHDTIEGIKLIDSHDNHIKYNNIHSSDYGIYLQNADSNDVITNQIHQNGMGIYFSGSSWSSEDNTITNNNIVENEDYQLYNGQDVEVDAQMNFWGNFTNASIDGTIYDDEEGTAQVNFYPFLSNTAPVPELPTVLLLLVGMVLVGIKWSDREIRK